MASRMRCCRVAMMFDYFSVSGMVSWSLEWYGGIVDVSGTSSHVLEQAAY